MTRFLRIFNVIIATLIVIKAAECVGYLQAEQGRFFFQMILLIPSLLLAEAMNRVLRVNDLK